MARHQPVNAAFMDELKGAYGDAETSQLLSGVFSALGVPYGESPDPSQYPVVGFYLHAAEQEFLLYVLTPGRFIRYEVASDSRSLTVVVPLSKVSRVIEQTGPSNVTVSVELDADAVMSISEYRESADPTDPSVLLGKGVGKTSRTTYDMTATTAAAGAKLLAFSLALRSSLGA